MYYCKVPNSLFIFNTAEFTIDISHVNCTIEDKQFNFNLLDTNPVLFKPYIHILSNIICKSYKRNIMKLRHYIIKAIMSKGKTLGIEKVKSNILYIIKNHYSKKIKIYEKLVKNVILAEIVRLPTDIAIELSDTLTKVIFNEYIWSLLPFVPC